MGIDGRCCGAAFSGVGVAGRVSCGAASAGDKAVAGPLGDSSADAIGASDGGVHFKADKFHGSAPRSIFKIGFLEV